MSTTAGERKHSGGASSEVKKKEGVSVLSLAIFVIFIAVGRSVYKARRDKAKLQHHHHHWLPLSQDELRTWRFTPLKSRQSLESSTPDIVEDDLKSDEEEPTNAKESGKKVPEQPKQKAKGTDNGVMHGWKIVCESVPCQQLLPGQLAEGGIISLEGTYGSCFDLIVGDDSLHVTSTSFSGVALLLAVRDSDYVMANTHEGGWQGEVTYRGPVFQPGQPFQIDLKFMNSDGPYVQLVVEHKGNVLLKRLISEFVVNSFKKFVLTPGNFQGCNTKGTATTFKRIEYLSR